MKHNAIKELAKSVANTVSEHVEMLEIIRSGDNVSVEFTPSLYHMIKDQILSFCLENNIKYREHSSLNIQDKHVFLNFSLRLGNVKFTSIGVSELDNNSLNESVIRAEMNAYRKVLEKFFGLTLYNVIHRLNIEVSYKGLIKRTNSKDKINMSIIDKETLLDIKKSDSKIVV
ncbi:MAG: hypothetical protein QXF12_05915 [Candidatus Aenigmatarchaeota archaeon]